MEARAPEGLERLQTPALLVDLDAVRHNVDRMIEFVGGDARRWRPHTKTSKVPAVLDVLLARGVTRFKCATTREARILLARATQPIDLLVAMAHRGPNLAACARLARQHPQHAVAVLTEDPEQAREARRLGLRLFVDLDPGMHRSGIPLTDHARIVATCTAADEALVGAHFYEGHLRQLAAAEREAAAAPLYARLVEVLERVPLCCGPARFEVTTSGTPALPCALGTPTLRAFDHSVGAGTTVYFDTTSRDFGLFGFRQAVHVAATVISRPDAMRATCNAGSKALDAAAGDPCCEVAGWAGLEAGHPSEEHLPLLVQSGAPPALGTRLLLVPRHVCPTVNLANEAVLVVGGRVHEVVPVAARGHDVMPE